MAIFLVRYHKPVNWNYPRPVEALIKPLKDGKIFLLVCSFRTSHDFIKKVKKWQVPPVVLTALPDLPDRLVVAFDLHMRYLGDFFIQEYN